MNKSIFAQTKLTFEDIRNASVGEKLAIGVDCSRAYGTVQTTFNEVFQGLFEELKKDPSKQLYAALREDCGYASTKDMKENPDGLALYNNMAQMIRRAKLDLGLKEAKKKDSDPWARAISFMETGLKDGSKPTPDQLDAIANIISAL